ncbi:hypothetical protein [Streptomyces flavidovirens]|uniref:hypothetical protein n=1 Tax=Streptomyces flavidovirens TaxID=67298 RepID=UPI0012FEF52C|nr:hypothetical protein [Streptomyces flavidovirens]
MTRRRGIGSVSSTTGAPIARRPATATPSPRGSGRAPAGTPGASGPVRAIESVPESKNSRTEEQQS